jgi:hypothetical protein
MRSGRLLGFKKAAKEAVERLLTEEKDFPARGTLVKRFCGLLKAYELVGYTSESRQR